MKPLSFVCAIAVMICCWITLPSQHPPPAAAALSGYGTVAKAGSTSCAIDPNFVPVHHTASRHLEFLLDKLAPAAGTNSEKFSIEMMRDRRGVRAINAMTCSDSHLIWISVTAWEQLATYEPALALLLAHELAHSDHRPLHDLKKDDMISAERQLMNSLSNRQLVEIAADQRAADIMTRAGYSPQQISRASWHILYRDVEGTLASGSESHPTGRDRANLLSFYLGRKYLNATIAR
ncbi:M48 family metalloprotease [Neolewinella persica]|uniref:hypothetical protein n=1 Tax=Neolewinella persica TaxID=70998 RepID=UPI0003A05A77|nr:hypothetical protein [Neolewinella persica]